MHLRICIMLYFLDFSTATFWESGDEDHNRVKTLTVTCSETAKPSSLYIHVDNTRDVAVSSICLLVLVF